MKSELRIKNLAVEVEGKPILKGVSLSLKQGQIGVVLGPNGSGKSTLGLAIMGHPRYRVTGGEVWLGDQDVLKLKPDKRAQAGLFLSFQNPVAIPGINVVQMMRLVRKSSDVYGRLEEKIRALRGDKNWLRRSLHEDFSGGEKKKMELLQALVLKPKFVILDELDTGLDIDALRLMQKLVSELTQVKNGQAGVIIITHNQELVGQMEIDKVWILKAGQIVKQGAKELIKKVEREGYASL